MIIDFHSGQPQCREKSGNTIFLKVREMLEKNMFSNLHHTLCVEFIKTAMPMTMGGFRLLSHLSGKN